MRQKNQNAQPNYHLHSQRRDHPINAHRVPSPAIDVFDEKHVTVYNKYTCEFVMQGVRDPKTTLYMIKMHLPAVPTSPTAPVKQVEKYLYETKSKQDLILFYHGA